MRENNMSWEQHVGKLNNIQYLPSFPNQATTKSLFPASTRTSQLRLPPSSKLHSTIYKGKDLEITSSVLHWL
ncbi:hypothetical protein CASFOL_028132 [Castilleja foliolosa]|uniref:Uncharacterized protein n=1 Tax=Castilleja foliolosa TaxID=1961234 RepID=A0ABD3CGX1_9LAMI